MAMVAVLRILRRAEKALVRGLRWGNCLVYSKPCLVRAANGYSCVCVCVCVCIKEKEEPELT